MTNGQQTYQDIKKMWTDKWPAEISADIKQTWNDKWPADISADKNRRGMTNGQQTYQDIKRCGISHCHQITYQTDQDS
jgi:hypothetical protein